MTSDKTPEQLHADQNLTLAVEECMRAYVGEDIDKYVLGDFVVLTSIQSLTENNILVTRYPVFMRDGDLPWYRTLGLVKMASLQMENAAMDPENNG